MNGHLNAALILLSRALEEIENGVVACEQCGIQEETKGLDFVDDLKATEEELIKLLQSNEEKDLKQKSVIEFIDFCIDKDLSEGRLKAELESMFKYFMKEKQN